ncbi:GWxTD domain-containing protein [Adhaeribacter soli]|uniref:GWxTD domain-containing protein n=1 Tax=Adhaeribacter soli TaxID=2607655 RepID=A0A5N1IS62_9BACT|nr:GWxTD domain-containing protein [Adhaeribacter soli]KAA9331176.1 GWxTD domain-containing protein [Adhaeribacter soli]
MKILLWLPAFAAVLLSVGCSRPPVPSKQNHGFQYKPESAVHHDLRLEGDSLHVYLKFADAGYFASPRDLQFSYAVYLSYKEPDQIASDSLKIKPNQLRIIQNQVYLDFKIPVSKIKYPSVLLTKITPRFEPKNALRHDIPLTATAAKPYILLDGNTGLPLFQNYVTSGQSFFIAQAGVPSPGELKQYEASFTAALPPMAKKGTNVPPGLKKLNTFSFLADTLSLTQPGLYAIEIGGKQAGGLFVETSQSFPELTTAQDLIHPLIYLTSSEERKRLYEAKDPKAAIDKFWLDVASGNQAAARRLIRVYYERVADANRFFSAHKAGWLTDRGMIYLVFGAPDIVNRFGDREEWAYIANQNHGDVRFVFSKKENTFTQNHYELVRSAYLESIWYNMVEQWRSGTIAN